MEPQAEMPKYKCHKEVYALKIKEIERDVDKAIEEDRDSTGQIFLHFEEDGYAPVKLNREWNNKHHPEEGGYYVVYEDGYTSWSPAEAFEKGYSRI